MAREVGHAVGLGERGLAPASPRSGAADVASAEVLRRALPDLFGDLDVRTLLHMGCGDGAWGEELGPTLDDYLGVDVEPTRLQNLPRDGLVRYRPADVLRDAFPKKDAVLCRDSLEGMSLDDARRALGNAVRSGARLLFASTYPQVTRNVELGKEGWRPLNLTLPPFELPPPKRLVLERWPDPTETYVGRSVGVWPTRLLSHLVGDLPPIPPASLFVHVPKASGTVFRVAAERAWGRERVACDYGADATTHPAVARYVHEERDLFSLSNTLIVERTAMLSGHFHYRQYRSLFPVEQVVTFLREPIARLVSEYHHFRRHHGFEGSLIEFAERPRNRNLQKSMLDGVPLTQMANFGVSEAYQSSLRLFGARLGWSLSCLELNVNPERRKLSGAYDLAPHEEAQLWEWNAEDLDFYHEAQRLFRDRLHEIEGPSSSPDSPLR